MAEERAAGRAAEKMLLADTAFACACNSYDVTVRRDGLTVAQVVAEFRGRSRTVGQDRTDR